MAPSGCSAAVLRATSTFAAVLPEEVRHRAQGLVVGRVGYRLSVLPRNHEASIDHSLHVVSQRRPGDVQLLLQLGRREPARACLNDSSKDGEASDVP